MKQERGEDDNKGRRIQETELMEERSEHWKGGNRTQEKSQRNTGRERCTKKENILEKFELPSFNGVGMEAFQRFLMKIMSINYWTMLFVKQLCLL